jgi:hypothetical protein
VSQILCVGLSDASMAKMSLLLSAGTCVSRGGHERVSSLISSWAARYLGQSRTRWIGSSVAPGQASHVSSSSFPIQ